MALLLVTGSPLKQEGTPTFDLVQVHKQETSSGSQRDQGRSGPIINPRLGDQALLYSVSEDLP